MKRLFGLSLGAVLAGALLVAPVGAASASAPAPSTAGPQVCEGMSREGLDGRPSQWDRCMAVWDTDGKAKNDNYEGGPHECDGLSTEAPPNGTGSERDRCMFQHQPHGTGTYEGSPSNPLPKVSAPKSAPQKQAAKPKVSSKSKASKAPAKKAPAKSKVTKKR